MKLFTVIGGFIFAWFLLGASVFGMSEQHEQSLSQSDEGVYDESTGLLMDIWLRIEDMGLPLDLTIFEGKFTLEQVRDFLRTIEDWLETKVKFRTKRLLRKTFEKKYRGILYRDFPDCVQCVICEKWFKQYHTCFYHILFTHFKLNEI